MKTQKNLFLQRKKLLLYIYHKIAPVVPKLLHDVAISLKARKKRTVRIYTLPNIYV